MSDMNISWQKILEDAIERPGVIHSAYSQFHNYSLGNQLLAMTQCMMRGIEPGPIGTFMHWKECGRHVRKGEKAITLCMPIACRTRKATADEGEDDSEAASCFTRFVYRNHWFVLAQTDGAEYDKGTIAGWNKEEALAALGISEIPFNALDGNAQGFATRRQISVSPIAGLPQKTLFHEIAHVVLGHTTDIDMNDSERTPRSTREIEAEAVALLCCESLGLPGADFCRGYIQAWGSSIPERSAQRIIHAAGEILKAGAR